MNSIEKLTEIFSHFPGIGPRQAKRFVYYLLSRKTETLDELIKNIEELKKNITTCESCQRFFERKQNREKICRICQDSNRNEKIIMLVQRDIDLESIEKNGGFDGKYFVLGGSIKILEKAPEKKIRISILKNLIETKKPSEIIIAVNWNPEGENTADYVEKEIKPLTQKFNIKISRLGKGLSMGTELEYTDPDTFKNALKNRS